MKYDAISPRELPRLIRAVRSTGRFQGTRGGRQVQIRLDSSLIGSPIEYGVCFGRQWHRGQAETVSAAVEGINQLSRRATA